MDITRRRTADCIIVRAGQEADVRQAGLIVDGILITRFNIAARIDVMEFVAVVFLQDLVKVNLVAADEAAGTALRQH